MNGPYLNYSKTCLIWHLCNPFYWVIWCWFSLPFDNFLCVSHCVIWHSVYFNTKFLSKCMSDKKGFTILSNLVNTYRHCFQICGKTRKKKDQGMKDRYIQVHVLWIAGIPTEVSSDWVLLYKHIYSVGIFLSVREIIILFLKLLTRRISLKRVHKLNKCVIHFFHHNTWNVE